MNMMQVKILDSENAKENKKGTNNIFKENPFQAEVLKNVNINGAWL